MKQDLHIFTGKGGVGKSVLALAYAQKLASQGESTLLVELGEASYYSQLFDKKIAYQPSKISENLEISKFSGLNCLQEYIAHLVKVQALADLFFDNKVMRAFVDAAPGLKELAILGKLTSGIRQWGPEFNYRHVVLDAYSSGHFMALLKAPLGLSKVIDMGPMGEQTRSIFQTLKGPQSHYYIVTLPEEMPASESIELAKETEALIQKKAFIFLNKNFDTKQINSADTHWQEEYNKHMQDLSKKMSAAKNQLEQSSYSMQVLPFVYNVSPLAVAAELKNEF